MRKIAAVALAGLALVGCAHKVWERPGATQQDFNKDAYECERDMRQGGYYGGGIAGALNAQSFQERCMVARGWSQQLESSSNSSTKSCSSESNPQGIGNKYNGC